MNLIKKNNLVLLNPNVSSGQGLFETMRCYNGKLFLLDEHIKRLRNSCGVLDMKQPAIKTLKQAVLAVIKKNKLVSGYLRLDVIKKGKGNNILAFTRPHKFYQDKDYKKGLSAVIIQDVRKNENAPLCRVKSLNRDFYNMLGERAKKQGKDEAIILNSKGMLCEGSRSNIFLVKKGKVFTPSIESGLLLGITRQVVIDICKRLKIKLRETKLTARELYTAEEAFLANSLIEIMPLVNVDNKTIGTGNPGKITQMILAKYRQMVVKECGEIR